ncbi:MULTISPECIES: RNase E specificity factor CsrD [Edwardsiella]|uniref:Diguanylate cyclase/phosphodiesterase n=3 Tax=Edwardsiella anguillarum TaxID=1821960 RepID=A0A076LQ88_9GAMM|nr:MULTISPECIES: RNase E specificity factor CsrD [Edwardsiella]AIJ07784.1 diguanylate cyclase/phosphodiesterase [Edwardsiella anguillarum ET080813]AKR78915.1 RNase E specificity factor CsrD [Edwardsiella sp. LADL05-105]KAB0590171.1 RNase E specificity factor CsrD [Edwardsiella anguillarum]UOU78806.1 RNase E specificity factor CsrD [Edwardsiella anguillarum]WHP83523.1 RNase E specificity factor CsrD [Edwardsiella anguillarum]
MRITTKFFAFITLLVALGMFLMLLGSTYSFYNQTHQRAETQLNILTAMIDQQLLTESRDSVKRWLPVMMRSAGAVELAVYHDDRQVYYHHLPALYNPWRTNDNLRSFESPLLQHPGYRLKMVYIEPTASYSHSLERMFPLSLSIGVMVIMLFIAYRWLRGQTQGIERLERRARRILSGDRDLRAGGVGEFPASASSALDCLLSELSDAREERSRIDSLIRAFAAQDSRTGLNNRLFFDNQLTTLLEDDGAHGVVMILRLPDLEALASQPGRRQREEFRYALTNMLSTYVMRYPSGLLAHYFQNNFAVLLPHRSLKEAEGFAAQLLASLAAIPSAPGVIADEVLHIGITLYRAGEQVESVMDRAEQAARSATLQGGNGWFVDPIPQPEMVRGSVRWRTLLEQTLARGGARLFHKPAVTVDGRVHHHYILPYIYDGNQPIPSAEFMPLVQQLGLAERFDRQMVSQIIPLLRRLPGQRLAFPLTVDSLLQRSFQRWLRDTLLQSERPLRQRILIELSEADVCAHQARLAPILRLLRGLECQVVVSQAGLRIVSTTYIKQLQVALVKLHPALVRNIDRRIENQLFVQSITGACEGTIAQVFATGVRSKEEWRVLREKGIAGGQGDFFAKSRPVL